jgi:hypothetical protein
VRGRATASLDRDYDVDAGVTRLAATPSDGGKEQDSADETADCPRTLHTVDYTKQTPFPSHAVRTRSIEIRSVIERHGHSDLQATFLDTRPAEALPASVHAQGAEPPTPLYLDDL